MRWKLRSAVGTGQVNRPDDVRIVQMLLNRSTDENKPHLLLKEDGIFGPKTSARILIFQIMNMQMWTFDGVVNPHGPTQLHLKNHKAKKTLHHTRRQTTLSHTKRNRNVICPDDEFTKLLEQKSKPDDKKTAWINRVLPAAINVKAHWGVPIAVTIAQGALESSWGTKAPGNMFFGVKGTSPLGNSVNVTTHENLREGTVVIQDSFRSYDSLDQSADDYGSFFVNNHRYSAAFNYKDDPEKFIHEVANAGYATNPQYEKLIIAIIRANGLSDYDKQYK